MIEAVTITPKVRSAVFKVWGERCAYCRDAPAEHLEHIFPRSKGGPDAIENFAPACASCNLRKRDLELAEGFLQIMAAQARGKSAAIRNLLEKRERAGAVHAPKPARTRPTDGHMIFDLGLNMDQCLALLRLRWSDIKDGEAVAITHVKDLCGFEDAGRWPFCRWRKVTTPSGAIHSGSSNSFIACADLMHDGTMSVTINEPFRSLVEYAIEHDAREFAIEGWAFSGDDLCSAFQFAHPPAQIMQSFTSTG